MSTTPSGLPPPPYRLPPDYWQRIRAAEQLEVGIDMTRGHRDAFTVRASFPPGTLRHFRDAARACEMTVREYVEYNLGGAFNCAVVMAIDDQILETDGDAIAADDERRATA